MKKNRFNVRAKDNHGHTYAVFLEESQHGTGKVVKFDGAPSGWRVESITTHTADRLAMDLGQGWYCINIQEVAAEIRAYEKVLAGLPLLSLQELQDEIARRS